MRRKKGFFLCSQNKIEFHNRTQLWQRCFVKKKLNAYNANSNCQIMSQIHTHLIGLTGVCVCLCVSRVQCRKSAQWFTLWHHSRLYFTPKINFYFSWCFKHTKFYNLSTKYTTDQINIPNFNLGYRQHNCHEQNFLRKIWKKWIKLHFEYSSYF